MPRELDSCVRQVKGKGASEDKAFAVCRAQLGSDAEIRARRKKARRAKQKANRKKFRQTE